MCKRTPRVHGFRFIRAYHGRLHRLKRHFLCAYSSAILNVCEIPADTIYGSPGCENAETARPRHEREPGVCPTKMTVSAEPRNDVTCGAICTVGKAVKRSKMDCGKNAIVVRNSSKIVSKPTERKMAIKISSKQQPSERVGNANGSNRIVRPSQTRTTRKTENTKEVIVLFVWYYCSLFRKPFHAILHLRHQIRVSVLVPSSLFQSSL